MVIYRDEHKQLPWLIGLVTGYDPEADLISVNRYGCLAAHRDPGSSVRKWVIRPCYVDTRDSMSVYTNTPKKSYRPHEDVVRMVDVICRNFFLTNKGSIPQPVLLKLKQAFGANID